jgi:cysteine synthase
LDYTADSRLEWVHRFAGAALESPAITPFLHADGSWLKLETTQILGSVKYRIVHARLLQAMAAGRIHQGSILTTLGSGSLGDALAGAGKRLGLGVELHASAGLPVWRRRQLEASGARVLLHPPQLGRKELLKQLRRRATQHGHWHLDPDDPLSFAEAYESLGQEILVQICRDCRLVPRILLCPAGSGKMIRLVGRRLKQALPDLKTVAVTMNPDSSMPPGVADVVERVEPETRPMRRLGHSLGLGGTACLRLVRRRNWKGVVILAPG